MWRWKRVILRVFLGCMCCGACKDATVIVGRTHDRAGDAAVPKGEPDAAKQPVADSGMQGVSTGVTDDQPALAAPARGKLWNVESGGRDAFCAGHGAAVHSEDCSPIERQLFGYALCACGDVAWNGEAFSVDAFDSRQGPYEPGQTGAPLGVDGALHPGTSDVQLGGSLIVTGAQPLVVNGRSFVVLGDLELAAPLVATERSVRVARDAWLASDVRGPGPQSVEIARTAYLRPDVLDVEALRGRVVRADFTLSPPCACDASSLLDVAAIVANARDFADNDAAGVSRDAWRGVVDTTFVALPCGRLVLSELTVTVGTILFSVAGRTALFIEGDVDLVGTIGFDIASGAELDMFVAGDFNVLGTVGMGNAMRPGALRIYVAGQVTASPTLSLAGALYAPRASIATLGDETYGALFVGSLDSDGSKQLHYDRAFLSAPATCPSAGRSCSSCDACADGLACVEGACAACTRDRDCCAPLVCNAGSCGPLLLTAP